MTALVLKLRSGPYNAVLPQPLNGWADGSQVAPQDVAQVPTVKEVNDMLAALNKAHTRAIRDLTAKHKALTTQVTRLQKQAAKKPSVKVSKLKNTTAR